jgi:hypothetical protein
MYRLIRVAVLLSLAAGCTDTPTQQAEHGADLLASIDAMPLAQWDRDGDDQVLGHRPRAPDVGVSGATRLIQKRNALPRRLLQCSPKERLRPCPMLRGRATPALILAAAPSVPSAP